MAKKKTEEKTVHRPADPNVMGLRGAVVEQPITRTLDENYMPYAMSVIVSRAIPEIDGFKPSHRKLLYTMYKMGLLNGKSAGRFDPASNLTLAEAAKLAACLNKIYETGKQDFASDPVWYLPYVEYLSEQGLMSISVADWSAKATRAQFAALLAASLPQEALVPINDISDGAIPDVSAGAWYHDAVYTLYRAGVLTGSGSNGSFLPDANIQRSEVAAIIARMADINQRKKVSLTPPMTAEK
mgnify:CR=1 FL=1